MRAVGTAAAGAAVLLLSGCSTPSGSTTSSAVTSSGLVCPSPITLAGVDPALRTALASGQARAIVTVGTQCAANRSASEGPALATLAEVKVAVQSTWGPGVQLVRDYDSLPLMLVTIAGAGQLDRLAGTAGVVAVSLERKAQPS